MKKYIYINNFLLSKAKKYLEGYLPFKTISGIIEENSDMLYEYDEKTDKYYPVIQSISFETLHIDIHYRSTSSDNTKEPLFLFPTDAKDFISPQISKFIETLQAYSKLYNEKFTAYLVPAYYDPKNDHILPIDLLKTSALQAVTTIHNASYEEQEQKEKITKIASSMIRQAKDLRIYNKIITIEPVEETSIYLPSSLYDEKKIRKYLCVPRKEIEEFIKADYFYISYKNYKHKIQPRYKNLHIYWSKRNILDTQEIEIFSPKKKSIEREIILDIKDMDIDTKKDKYQLIEEISNIKTNHTKSKTSDTMYIQIDPSLKAKKLISILKDEFDLEASMQIAKNMLAISYKE